MLHDKLEQASQEARRKRIQVTISLFAIAALVALILLGVIKIDLTTFGLTQESNEQVPVTAGLAAPIQPSQENVQEARPKQRPPSVSIETPRISELRDAFKREISIFEDSIEPHVLSKGFANWNIDRQHQVLTKKDDAVSSFSSGDYERALVGLKEASQASIAEITKWNTASAEAISNARSFYERDDYNAASLNISDALRLKPQSLEAKKLKEKITRLPKVLESIQKAAVARTENNLEAEVEYLKEAIDSDSSRNELSERLGAVEEKIRELHFAQSINSGLANTDQKNIVAARLNLKKAASIFNERSEVALLSRKVKALELELEVERLIKEAEAASESDNWTMAETLYHKAGKINPNIKDVVDGYALALKINSLNGKLAQHLQAPHRLSSINVAELVRVLVTEAMTVSAQSYSLSDQTIKLLELLKVYSVKVSVKVISDGITNISVRGVGRVGLTNEKTIDLRPGKYTFEGKRTGYRSKLIQVDVPPGSENIVVEIYTDERI